MVRNKNHIHSALCFPQYTISSYITTNPEQRWNPKRFHGCRYSTMRGFHHPSSLQPTVGFATNHDLYQLAAHKPFQATGRQWLLLFQERKSKVWDQQISCQTRTRNPVLQFTFTHRVHIAEGDYNRNCWLQHNLCLPVLTASSSSIWQQKEPWFGWMGTLVIGTNEQEGMCQTKRVISSK